MRVFLSLQGHEVAAPLRNVMKKEDKWWRRTEILLANPQPYFWAPGVKSTLIMWQYRDVHLCLVQLDWVGAQDCAIKLAKLGERGRSEEQVFIGYVYLYPHFGNCAVARDVFKFRSWVPRSNVLPLKIPGKQRISEMWFGSFFPEPWLSLTEELVMMTLALK